jgi:hypothetical protein
MRTHASRRHHARPRRLRHRLGANSGDNQRVLSRARAPHEAEFRALYKELIETNTTLSVGSCTQSLGAQ